MKKLTYTFIPAVFLFMIITQVVFGRVNMAKATPTPSPTSAITSTPTIQPTATATPTPLPTGISPNAPLCPTHSNDEFHTLWNDGAACHYDHEHGTNPFTPEVDAAFPGFDLFALLGNVEIGHTNPSSPHENTDKHGGFKWDVNLDVTCEVFESANYCVKAAVIQYHAFGDYAVEMETRNHTTVFLGMVCNPANPADCGYLYTVQLQEYGQRVSQYQGSVLPYPDTPLPAYAANFGPYFTIDRYGTCTGCRPSLAFVRNGNYNANSVWTSKPTGTGVRPQTSTLFRLLFRVRDNYQLLEWASIGDGYPFNFGFVCGETAYNPANCRYNNTTTRVHEVAGNIPTAWDGLIGFDTDARPGRVTAVGYTTAFGELDLSCAAPGGGCHPVKLVGMFVGSYGGQLPGAKVSNPNAISNPERDFYFLNGQVVSEGTAGAVASGWVGGGN